MQVSEIKLKIEGQLKNQTNYIHHNIWNIYKDISKVKYLSPIQKHLIQKLQNDFETLEDPWTYSGVPEKEKVVKLLKNLQLLYLVIG